MLRYGKRGLRAICLGMCVLGWPYLAQAQIHNDTQTTINLNHSYTILTNVFAGGFEATLSEASALVLDYEWDYQGSYETDITAQYQIFDAVTVYGGIHAEDETEASLSALGIAGLTFSTPTNLKATDLQFDVQFSSDGNVEVEISSEFELSNEMNFEWAASTEGEYSAGVIYNLDERLSVVLGWDSDLQWGAGLRLGF